MKSKILSLVLCLSLCANNLPIINVHASDSNQNTIDTSINTSEKKRYIIVFKDKPVSASVKKYVKKAKELEKTAFKTQNVSIKKIEKITKTKVRNKNTFLVNSCSIDATYDEAMKIKKLSTVADCYEAFAYTPTMEKAVDLCDVNDVWNDTNLPLDGEGTIISIIDTGVDYNHTDMRVNSSDQNFKYSQNEMKKKIKDLGHGRYVNLKVPYAYNYAERCEASNTNIHYHGTHVAGIAASNTASDHGITGVAYNSQILAMQVFPGSGKCAFTDDIVNAIEDSVKLGADVINLSLGTWSGYTDYDSMELKAINAAYNSGCIISAAAGNERNSATNISNGYNNQYRLCDTGIVDNPGSLSNVLTVAGCEKASDKNGHIKIYDLSSWGPTPELELKPEITAPAVNIKSLAPNNDYKITSGTSMATPFIAGVSALVKESTQKKNLNLSSSSLSNYIKHSIMNTATPLMDYTIVKGTVPYSVRQQGSGLVNAKNAIDNNVIATYKGDAAIELRNIKEGTTSIPIEIKLTNYGKSDKTYSLSDCPLYTEAIAYYARTDNWDTLGPCYLKNLKDSYVHFNYETVTVKAGKSTKITGYVNLSKDMKTNQYVEGFVSIEGDISLNLPLLGFYGNWDMLPIFDELSGSENCVMDKYEYGLSTYITDKDENKLGYFNNEFDINNSAISLNPETNNNIAIPCLTRLRNAYNVNVSVVDSNNNLVHNVGNYSYLRKRPLSSETRAKPIPISSYQEDYAYWDGTRYDEKTKKTVTVEDGQYYFIIKAQLTKKAPYQSYKIPIRVDSIAPDVNVKYEYNETEHKIYFDVLASDNFENIPTISFTVNDYGSYITRATFNYNTDGVLLDNGYKRFTMEDVTLISDYIDVKIQDYAKNTTRKLVLGNSGFLDEDDEKETTQTNSEQSKKDTNGPVVDIISDNDNLTKINYYDYFMGLCNYVAQIKDRNKNIEFTFKISDQSGLSHIPFFSITEVTITDGKKSKEFVDLKPEEIDESTYKLTLTPEDLKHTYVDEKTLKERFDAEFIIHDGGYYSNKTKINFILYFPEDGPENYVQDNITPIKTYIPNQCIINKDMLNTDNTYTVNLDVKGKAFDSATINGVNAEMIYPENYEYTNIPSRIIKLKADIPITVGKNYYTVCLYKHKDETDEKELIYQQSFGTILYNGDNISFAIKSESPLEDDIYLCNGNTFNFNLNVKSKIDALKVLINNSVVYSYTDIYTNYAEDNIVTLPLSYKLNGKDVNTLKIKVVDISGNENEKIIYVKNVCEEPATEESSSEEPFSEEPSLEEPSSEEPSLEEPSSEEPSSEEPPSEEPSLEEPSSEEPALEEPSSEEPATVKPANSTNSNTSTNSANSTADTKDIKDIKDIKDSKIHITPIITYTGKKIKPVVSITDGDYTLKENIDFKVNYKNNKKIGKAKVIIIGIKNYAGIIIKTFNIVPRNSKIKKVSKCYKGKVTLKAKKLKYKVKYEFFYSTKKKGKYKKLGISKRAILKTHKLKCNKKYFIKVRTFKKVMGTKYSSSFSKAKKVIIKK